jgi:hypothetical protein
MALKLSASVTHTIGACAACSAARQGLHLYQKTLTLEGLRETHVEMAQTRLAAASQRVSSHDLEVAICESMIDARRRLIPSRKYAADDEEALSAAIEASILDNPPSAPPPPPPHPIGMPDL